MKTVTVNGTVYNVRYDYYTNKELHLHKAWIGETQVFGNGLVLSNTDFFELVSGIHHLESESIHKESGNF